MSRLTEAIEKYKELSKEKDCLARTFRGFRDYGNPKSTITSGAENNQNLSEEYAQLAEWLEKLKQYKDKEDQGLLIELPLKVGDTFWELSWSNDSFYPRTAHSLSHVVYCMERLGKWCFLTEAEAEEALARMKGE